MRKYLHFIIAVLSLTFIFASSTGTGGTAANNGLGVSWTNPTNGQACDNTYTTYSGATGTSSKYLLVTNFGFALPSSTIDGVVVALQAKSTQSVGGCYDSEVKLVKSGTAAGDNKATSTIFSTTEETRNYGSSSDTWAAGFTYTDWNTSTSGVRIQFTDPDETETGYIDCVQITVYYTEASGTKRYLIGQAKSIEVQ